MPSLRVCLRGRALPCRGARGVAVIALALTAALLLPTELHAKRARKPALDQLLILPLEHELGKDADRMRPVERAFRDEAEALERFRVLPRAKAANLLDSVRSLGLDCEPGDLECLTKAGVIMEIELLAVLRAAASQERLVVTAILIDVSTGRTRSTVSRTLVGGDSLRAVMRSAAVELLAPDLFVGSLVLDVAQDGASVRIDGALRGETPLPKQIGGLAPGEHVVSVEKAGFAAVERVVAVKALEDTTVVIDLQAEAPAPEPRAHSAAAEAPAPATHAPAASALREPRSAPTSSSSTLPLLPIVFGSVAAAGAVTTVGVSTGALWMNERFKDTALAPAERRDARAPGQLLVVVAVTTGVIALLAGGAAGASALWAP